MASLKTGKGTNGERMRDTSVTFVFSPSYRWVDCAVIFREHNLSVTDTSDVPTDTKLRMDRTRKVKVELKYVYEAITLTRHQLNGQCIETFRFAFSCEFKEIRDDMGGFMTLSKFRNLLLHEHFDDITQTGREDRNGNWSTQQTSDEIFPTCSITWSSFVDPVGHVLDHTHSNGLQTNADWQSVVLRRPKEFSQCPNKDRVSNSAKLIHAAWCPDLNEIVKIHAH